ncbi:hypothetical protein Goklo_016047, partial [Gossypium klotzschianum]|nr:hypothetical protein [Gossypium klotzschianum]
MPPAPEIVNASSTGSPISHNYQQWKLEVEKWKERRKEMGSVSEREGKKKGEITFASIWELVLKANDRSGRLIRTLANVKYGNYHLTPVEIIYNIVSFIIAIVTTIAFTVYAKRALSDLGNRESEVDDESASYQGGLEMEKLPDER